MLSSRHSDNDCNAARLLSSLCRGGHVERVVDGCTYIVASNPVLVVANSSTETMIAEWIGARVEKTIDGLAKQLDLAVHSTAVEEGYSRTFLSGHQEQLEIAALAVGGKVEFAPGMRLLKMFPILTRESFTGERITVPSDQPLERLAFKERGKLWKQVKYFHDLPSGVYRINERPIRWLWHENAIWHSLDGPERLSAAWFQFHVHGGLTIVYDKTRGTVEIERTGFPLPLLVDRALRLIGGPPSWNRKSIIYFNLDRELANQLARVMRLHFRIHESRNSIAL
jgi:hypothetical protein